MSDHPTSEQLELYHRLTLPPDDLKQISQHLAGCDVCKQKYRKIIDLPSRDTSLGRYANDPDEEDPDHLSPLRVEAYVEGTLDDFNREIVESHIEFCKQCAEQVARQKADQDHPAKLPLVPLPGETKANFFNGVGQIRPIYVLCAVVVALIILVSAVVLQRSNNFTQVAHNASVLQPPPAASESKTPADAVPQINSSETRLENAPASNTNSRSKADPSPKNRLLRPSASKTTHSSASQILFVLNSGGQQVKIDAQNRVIGLPVLAPVQNKIVTTALIKQEITDVKIPPEHAVKSLEVRSAVNEDARSASPSDKPSVTLLSPIGTYIGDVYATLKWRPVKGASSLTVSVVNQRFEPVVPPTEVDVTATGFKIPVALTPSMTYTWQVKATVDGKEVKSSSETGTAARFTVLGRQRLDQVQRLKRRYANSHLVLGVLYAREGLLDDAERELQEMLKSNPKSPVARKLLSSLQSRRTPRTP